MHSKMKFLISSLLFFTLLATTLPAKVFKREAVYGPRPQYPQFANGTSPEGRGTFILDVNTTGMVIAVITARSTGSKLLDDAAITAFKKWRFEPLASNFPVQIRVTFWHQNRPDVGPSDPDQPVITLTRPR
jgi:TonB family protein